MSEALAAPAETYKLNVLASVLGRYAVSEPTPETVEQVGIMLDTTIDDIRSYDVPEITHTSPVLLEEAEKFDEKLLAQVRHGPAVRYMSPSQQTIVASILERHRAFCADSQRGDASWERLVAPNTIAAAYGLPDLWSNPAGVIESEVQRWGKSTVHPAIPPILEHKIGLQETKELLGLMWRRVIGVTSSPDVAVSLTDDDKNYHVYWAPLAEKLDYTTPRGYDRAIQLSFDVPHNATHLAHLDVMDPTDGAMRYDDNMAQRAYFEAATVFSEYKEVEVAETDSEFGEELADIFQVRGLDTPNQLAAWVSQDRRYEFKLRAARYAADVLMMEGQPLAEIVATLSSTFGVPNADAEKETRKYAAWTGLGAAYTFGYRKLLESGISSVIDVIQTTDGRAVTSWDEFRQA